jgi:ABC-type amino acid transport substrate-binding protein
MTTPFRGFRGAFAAALLLASGARLAGAEDLDAIRARGTLRVIFGSYGMPEAITLQPGAPPGLEREMIEGFAALNRLKVEFVAVDASGERIPALLANKGDVVVGGLGITEERRKVVDFTAEVFPSRHVVVTRKPHAPIETLEQLRKVRVGSIKGSSWAETVAAAGLPPENVDITNVRRSSTWHRLVIKYYGELALEVLKRARAAS